VQQALAQAPAVLGVAQIGSSLRVLLERRAGGAGWLRTQVQEIDAKATIEPVGANLEDVFVAATGAPRKEAA